MTHAPISICKIDPRADNCSLVIFGITKRFEETKNVLDTPRNTGQETFLNHAFDEVVLDKEPLQA
jgi:hypothetical protein